MSESPEKPTTPLAWAASGVKTPFSGAKILNGWLNKDVVPFDQLNWRWDLEAQWQVFVAAMVGRQYTVLNGPTGGVAETVPGERLRLFDDQPEPITGSRIQKGGIFIGGDTIGGVACDGEFIYVADGDGGSPGSGVIQAWDTSFAGGVPVWSYTHAEGVVGEVRTDGNLVTMTGPNASGSTGTYGLTILEAASGSVIAEIELSVVVRAAYPDSNPAVGGNGLQVWYLTDPGGTGGKLRRWTDAIGSIDIHTFTGQYAWDIVVHRDAIYAVTGDNADNWLLWCISLDETGATTGSMFQIAEESSGAGHGASGVGAKICCDGDRVYVLIGRFTAGRQPEVVAFDVPRANSANVGGAHGDSARLIWQVECGFASLPLTDPEGCDIECDDRYVYVLSPDTYTVLEKDSGRLVREDVFSGATNNRSPNALDMGTQRVWMPGGEADGRDGVYSYPTGRASSQWRRVDPVPVAGVNDPHRHHFWRKKALPEGSPY